jgi:hypothetical protein
VNLGTVRNLFKEQVLVNIIDSELKKHSSQICQVNELLFVSLAFEVSYLLDICPEGKFVPKQLGAKESQVSFVRHLERRLDSLQRVQPGVQVHDVVVLLVEAQEVRQSLDFISRDILGIQLLNSRDELIPD